MLARAVRPNILRAARRGLFRVFGDGDTAISMTYVDNFCHGLMLAEKALKPGSSILGGSYIITDGPPCNFWRTMDHVVTELYGPDASIFKLYSLPEWFILSLARVCDFVTAVTGYPLKLNSFAAKVRTSALTSWSSLNNPLLICIDAHDKPVLRYIERSERPRVCTRGDTRRWMVKDDRLAASKR